MNTFVGIALTTFVVVSICLFCVGWCIAQLVRAWEDRE